jgi:hypothetical protein
MKHELKVLAIQKVPRILPAPKAETVDAQHQIPALLRAYASAGSKEASTAGDENTLHDGTWMLVVGDQLLAAKKMDQGQTTATLDRR